MGSTFQKELNHTIKWIATSPAAPRHDAAGDKAAAARDAFNALFGD